MCLIDLEEWWTLQAILPHLHRAVEHGIKEISMHESAPHASGQYGFLVYELKQLVISIPANRDVDQDAISIFKRDVIELFEKIYSVLLRIMPSDPSLLYIRKLLGLQAPSGKSAHKYTGADSPTFKVLSLSDVDIILPAFTSFNKNIEYVFRARLHETTLVVESTGLSSVALSKTKRELIDALLMSLEQHMDSCKRRSRHHVLLQGAGQSWQAENNSLISLFLSSCREPTEWQEIECLPDEYLPRDKHKENLRPLQSLCEDITIAQCYNEVLNLLLRGGALYKQPREQKHGQRRAMVQVKTLEELIEKQRFSPLRSGSLSADSFTIPEKRELSLNLGWCFLYLFDCPWTNNGWSADTISLLLSTTGSSSPLEFETSPYIRCDPKSTSPGKGNNNDLSIIMNDSVFLALGKLLVEMELGRRITATECDRHGQSSLWLTLDKILNEDGMLSACEDYLKAIEGCLELHRSIFELTPEERITQSAKLIYDSIVANLEKDFAHYRKPSKKRRRSVSPPSTDLQQNVSVLSDSCAIRIPRPHSEDVNIGYTGAFEDLPTPNFEDFEGPRNNKQLNIQPGGNVTVAGQELKQMTKRARIATGHSILGSKKAAISSLLADSGRTATFPSAPSGFVRIFDDLESHTATADSRALSSSRFFLAEMDLFIESYLRTNHTRPSQRVKVCIIDTGIDKTHPSLQAAKQMGKLRKMKNFKGDGGDFKDEIGHGTNVAELILTLAPEAELFVAKVAVAKTMPRDDTRLITEAIEWALSEDADIISLSLGLDILDPKLDSAINKTAAAGKIVVAAAGNDGNNKPRAYPGSNRNVLCIHASNGKGKDGGISPRALDNDDNFMTLGTAIPLIWENKEVVKFGTSFATAVAAAIAADALAIIPSLIPLTENQLKRLYSCDGMRRIFTLFSKPSDNGYKYVAPWNFFGENRSSELIRELILDTLKR